MILICGLPNAGKTTYSAIFENVIHLDDIPHKTFGEQLYKCNRLAAANEHSVVEGVYNTKRRRRELLRACKSHQKKVCVWIDTPYEECVRRENRGRPHIVAIHYKMFEPPTLDEGWDEIIIVRGKNE